MTIPDALFVALARRATYPPEPVLRRCRELQLQRLQGGTPCTMFDVAVAQDVLSEEQRRRFLRWAAQVQGASAQPLVDSGEGDVAVHPSAASLEPAREACPSCGAALDPLEGPTCLACQTAAPEAPETPAAVAPEGVDGPKRRAASSRRAALGRRGSSGRHRTTSARAPRARQEAPASRLVLGLVVGSGVLLLGGAALLLGGPEPPSEPVVSSRPVDESTNAPTASPPAPASAPAAAPPAGPEDAARGEGGGAGASVEASPMSVDDAAPSPAPDAAALAGEPAPQLDAPPPGAGAAAPAPERAVSSDREEPAATGEEPAPTGVGPAAPRAEPAPTGGAPAASGAVSAEGRDRDPPQAPGRDPAAGPVAPPDPSATPAPARPSPRAARAAALRLLAKGCQAYEGRDLGALRDVSEELAALPGVEAYAQAVAGLLHHRERRFGPAFDALAAALGREELAGAPTTCWRALARLALCTGHYDAALRAAAQLPTAEAQEVALLVRGPFHRDFPLASAALAATTPGGHYRVVTDLGLAPNDLHRLEQALEEVDPEARERYAAQARRKHQGLLELLDVMDKAYDAYAQLFPAGEPAGVVPSVYVFADEVGFREFSRQLRIHDTEHVLGYYLPAYRVLAFYDQPGDERVIERKRASDSMNRMGLGTVPEGQEPDYLLAKPTRRVLLHETFHQWLHLYVDDAPPWFNEGLAEFFGISELTPRKLRYGLVPNWTPSRLDDLRAYLRGEHGPMWSLQRLASADRPVWDQQAVVNYAHAWSFVHFLAASRKRQQLLRDYFGALREGADVQRAYREVFAPLDMDAMERTWRRYVSKLR